MSSDFSNVCVRSCLNVVGDLEMTLPLVMAFNALSMRHLRYVQLPKKSVGVFCSQMAYRICVAEGLFFRQMA